MNMKETISNKKEGKKIRAFVIVIVIFFLLRWYGDQLTDSFPLVYLSIFFLCMIALIGLAALIIVARRKTQNILLGNMLIIGSVLFVFCFPCRYVKMKIEMPMLETQRMKVVEKIKEKTLKSDSNGNVKLPLKYTYTSAGGEVTLYESNNSNVVVGFWIFRGMLSGSSELIYSTTGENAIMKSKVGNTIEKIEEVDQDWYYVVTSD